MPELIELTGPAPKPGRYVKVSLFLRKRADLSDDYFHAYWANNHVKPAFESPIFMEKVRRYNQVCLSLQRKFTSLRLFFLSRCPLIACSSAGSI
jgi:hypothetical protein